MCDQVKVKEVMKRTRKKGKWPIMDRMTAIESCPKKKSKPRYARYASLRRKPLAKIRRRCERRLPSNASVRRWE